jgi:hypothetical protein
MVRRLPYVFFALIIGKYMDLITPVGVGYYLGAIFIVIGFIELCVNLIRKRKWAE